MASEPAISSHSNNFVALGRNSSQQPRIIGQPVQNGVQTPRIATGIRGTDPKNPRERETASNIKFLVFW